MSQRYIIEDGMLVPLDVDEAVAQKNAELQTIFRRHWSKHRCGVTGCGSCLIIDGGMYDHTSFYFA